MKPSTVRSPVTKSKSSLCILFEMCRDVIAGSHLSVSHHLQEHELFHLQHWPDTYVKKSHESLPSTWLWLVVGAAFVIDLPDLGGAKRIEALGVPVTSLIEFAGH